MQSRAVLDLLKFYSPSLERIGGTSSYAFIVADGQETGFLHRDKRFGIKLADMGYETLVSMKDAKSGVYATVCIDPSTYLVERTLAATFCDTVSVASMTASEQNGRLEMPALTVTSEVRDIRAEKFPWIGPAVEFANKCSRYADLSTPGIAKYTLNTEVKRAWNEFYKKSFGLFLHAPQFDVKWREELGVNDTETLPTPELKPAEIVKRMRAHPKEDKKVDLSSFRKSIVTDWRG